MANEIFHPEHKSINDVLFELTALMSDVVTNELSGGGKNE